jgi:hypothetical protein
MFHYYFTAFTNVGVAAYATPLSQMPKPVASRPHMMSMVVECAALAITN